jgi:hypothetical protein
MENGWRGRIYQLTGQTPTSAFTRQPHSRSHQPKQHRPVSGDVKPARNNRNFLNKTRSLILLSHFHPYLIGVRQTSINNTL